jgi:hypothetical protein
VGEEHLFDGFGVEVKVGEPQLLEDVRKRRPTAEFVWDFKGDRLFLEVEWHEDGEYCFERYLSSPHDMRYVHLLEHPYDEEMTA